MGDGEDEGVVSTGLSMREGLGQLRRSGATQCDTAKPRLGEDVPDHGERRPSTCFAGRTALTSFRPVAGMALHYPRRAMMQGMGGRGRSGSMRLGLSMQLNSQGRDHLEDGGEAGVALA